MRKRERSSTAPENQPFMTNMYHNRLVINARILSVILLIAGSIILLFIPRNSPRPMDASGNSLGHLSSEDRSVYALDEIAVLSRYADDPSGAYYYVIAQPQPDGTIFFASLKVNAEHADSFEQRCQVFDQSRGIDAGFTTSICAFISGTTEALNPSLHQFYTEKVEQIRAKNGEYLFKSTDLSCTYAFQSISDYPAYHQLQKEKQWIGFIVGSVILAIGIGLAAWGFHSKFRPERRCSSDFHRADHIQQ